MRSQGIYRSVARRTLQGLICLRVVGSLVALVLTASCSHHEPPPDNRTRVNEVHLLIHQDADEKSPIIGWVLENGTPSKGDFHVEVKSLSLTIIGSGDHPDQCVLSIQRYINALPANDDPELDELDKWWLANDPDSVLDAKTTTIGSKIVPCNETPNSFLISWPDVHVALKGRLDQTTGENGEIGPWEYHIDTIQEAPKNVEYDPPGFLDAPDIFVTD